MKASRASASIVSLLLGAISCTAGVNEVLRRNAPAADGADATDETSVAAPRPDGSPRDGATAAEHYGGVNLAGGEFGSALPGVSGTDFVFPSHAEVDYYLGKKMNIFRLPFRWERMQPALDAEIDPTYFALLDDVVQYITSKGGTVVLDPHNFGRFRGQVVGSDAPSPAFAGFWSKLSARYKQNGKVVFSLMNEPHDQPADAWLGAVNAAIAAIRAAGATNLVTVPGIAWTSGRTWVSSGNATTMLGVVDSANKSVYEIHQYLDSDGSGTNETCISETIGSENLKAFTEWAIAHQKRAFLGEFAGGRNPTCLAALDDILNYIDRNREVWMGWTYWAAGSWWPATYIFALDPTGDQDRPQMAPLLKHLGTF
jgi:endoglucanase